MDLKIKSKIRILTGGFIREYKCNGSVSEFAHQDLESVMKSIAGLIEHQLNEPDWKATQKKGVTVYSHFDEFTIEVFAKDKRVSD